MLSLIFAIIGVLLIIAALGLIWVAIKPTSTGNGAGAMAGLILISGAMLTGSLGAVSLLVSLIIFVVGRL
jgi:hypothetical protein